VPSQHLPPSPDKAEGIQGTDAVKKLIAFVHGASPWLFIEVVDELAEGGRGVLR